MGISVGSKTKKQALRKLGKPYLMGSIIFVVGKSPIDIMEPILL